MPGGDGTRCVNVIVSALAVDNATFAWGYLRQRDWSKLVSPDDNGRFTTAPRFHGMGQAKNRPDASKDQRITQQWKQYINATY